MGIKVLIVDDEKEFVDPLAQRLELREFEVNKAFSGDQALGIVGKQDVDVVILDVLMPGKGGVETLRELKMLKPLVEVIMLTGHATVETAIEGMKLGAYDYLMKPAETEQLVEKIHAAYSRKADQEKRIQEANIAWITKTKGW